MDKSGMIWINLSSKKIIESIISKRGLWDTNTKNAGVRSYRKRAWIDVASYVVDGFFSYDRKTKINILSKIRNRWRSIQNEYIHPKKSAGTKKINYYDDRTIKLLEKMKKRLTNNEKRIKNQKSIPLSGVLSKNGDDKNSDTSSQNIATEKPALDCVLNPKTPVISSSSRSSKPIEIHKSICINETKSNPSDRFGIQEGESSDISNQNQAPKESATNSVTNLTTPIINLGSEQKSKSVIDVAIINKRKKCDKDLKRSILKTLIYNTPKTKDDDILFFNSIIPMMHTMNDIEKLEFRANIIDKLINITTVSSNTVLPEYPFQTE